MHQEDLSSQPRHTLTGLGPPEPASEPYTARPVPETLRPVAISEDEVASAELELEKLRVPFSPVVPGFRRIALGALALGAAASVGFFLGRAPLSHHTRVSSPAVQPPVIDAARSATQALLPSTGPATQTEEFPPLPSAEPESAAPEADSPHPKRKRHHRHASSAAADVAGAVSSATPPAQGPDPDRIRSVAEGVQLEDDPAE